MKSRWFERSSADATGLTLRGEPSAHAADLHLGPESVLVSFAHVSAALEWSDFRPQTGVVTQPEGSTWSVAPFTVGRSGSIGIALSLSGDPAANAKAVVSATNTRHNRFLRFGSNRGGVPLRAIGHVSMTADAERDTLTALCFFLAADPTARSRLGDAARVQRLAGDLAEGVMKGQVVHFGIRRSTVEVLNALHLSGYQHKLGGRPVPGRPLPSLDDLVKKVLDRIAQNPYARGVTVEPEVVAHLVRRHYLDVAPWPFGALTA